MSDKPFLRVLKLAYKLHKSGLSVAETTQFVCNCRNKIDEAAEHSLTPLFPSGSVSPCEILLGAFVWADSIEGHGYWSAIYLRLLSEGHGPKC